MTVNLFANVIDEDALANLTPEQLDRVNEILENVK